MKNRVKLEFIEISDNKVVKKFLFNPEDTLDTLHFVIERLNSRYYYFAFKQKRRKFKIYVDDESAMRIADAVHTKLIESLRDLKEGKKESVCLKLTAEEIDTSGNTITVYDPVGISEE
jgi:hypothetical protein